MRTLTLTSLSVVLSAFLAACSSPTEAAKPTPTPLLELPALGPSTSTASYNTAVKSGVQIVPLLTVADPSKTTGNAYAMRGIPDGLGAYDNGDGTFTVLMNHEISSSLGVTRAHGAKGAFVSQYVVKKSDLSVVSGADMVQSVGKSYTYDRTTARWTNTAALLLSRLCSGDLSALGAFYNAVTGKGYNGRIYLNGEESAPEGRAVAWVATGADAGTVWTLPALGRSGWENWLAHPNTGDKTIVIGQDDSTPGQVYVYVGNKATTGNAVEKAGLHGGTLYGVKVTNGGANYADGAVTQENAGAISGSFSLVSLGDVSAKTGATLQTDSVTAGVTEFARPEDGAWDTKNANVYYFVTTGATVTTVQTSRLYKLTFTDVNDPTQGGTIALVKDYSTLTGADGQTAPTGVAMFDNLAVDLDGNILLQEDPGNNAYRARMWRITPAGAAEQLTVSDANKFVTGGTGFLTQDEENSGIIDVTSLMTGYDTSNVRYYLGDMQVHTAAVAAADVGLGQLWLMAVPK